MTAGAVTQGRCVPGMFERQQEGSSDWNGLNKQRVGRGSQRVSRGVG